MRGSFDSNPLKGVEWSLAYLAFCVYIFCIVSYRLPLGTVSMAVALLTVPMEKTGIRLPPIVALTFGLVGWAVIGVGTSSYPDIVLESVQEFAKLAAVVFVAVNVLVTRARIRFFLVMSTVTYCLFPVRGTMLAYFVYHGDMNGRATWNYIYSNPNDLAGLMMLSLSVALGVLAVERKKWVRLGSAVGAGLMVLIVFLTQSRGAMIALIAFGLFGARKFLADVRRIALIVVVGIAVVAVSPDAVWRRFSTISMATEAQNTDLLDPDLEDLATRQDQGSSVQRLEIWKVAMSIIADNPITGVGMGAYPEAHFKRAVPPRFNWIARGHRDTHSTYLNLMAEMGLVGFGIFATMIVLTMRKAFRVRKLIQAKFPAGALQLFNLQLGLFGFLVAAIWGTYWQFIATYVHIVVINMVAEQLERDNEAGAPQFVRRGGMARRMPPAADAARASA